MDAQSAADIGADGERSMDEILSSIRRLISAEEADGRARAGDRALGDAAARLAAIDALADALIDELTAPPKGVDHAGGDPLPVTEEPDADDASWPSRDAFMSTADAVGVGLGPAAISARARAAGMPLPEPGASRRPFAGRRGGGAAEPEPKPEPKPKPETKPEIEPETVDAADATDALNATDAPNAAPETSAQENQNAASARPQTRTSRAGGIAARVGASLPELREAAFALRPTAPQAGLPPQDPVASAPIAGVELPIDRAPELQDPPEPEPEPETEQEQEQEPARVPATTPSPSTTEPEAIAPAAPERPVSAAPEPEREPAPAPVTPAQLLRPQSADEPLDPLDPVPPTPDNPAPALQAEPIEPDQPRFGAAPATPPQSTALEPEAQVATAFGAGEVGRPRPPSPSAPRSRGAPLPPKYRTIIDKIAEQIKSLALERLERGEHSLNRPPPQPHMADFLGLSHLEQRRLGAPGGAVARLDAPSAPDTAGAPPPPAEVLELTANMRAAEAERDAILTEASLAAAHRAFEALADPAGEAAQTILRTSRERGGVEQDDLDAIARDTVRPMLAEWLNAHLPTLVEQIVREEISRVRGQGAPEADEPSAR